MDELDARVRSLEAERLRPVPPAPGPVTGISHAALYELCRELGEEESGLVVGQQEPPHVLTGVTGQLDQLNLLGPGVPGLTKGLPQVPMGFIEALRCGFLPPDRHPDVRHCLLLIHGDMFAHARVATYMMIPP